MTTNLLLSLQDPEYSIDFQIVDATQLKPTKVALSCVNMLKNSLEIANLMPDDCDKHTYKFQVVKRLTFAILKVYVNKFEELCNDYMKNEGKFFNLITLPFNNNTSSSNKKNQNNDSKLGNFNQNVSSGGFDDNFLDNNDEKPGGYDNIADYENIPVNEYLESLMKLHNSTRYVSDKLRTFNKSFLFKKLFKVALEINGQTGDYNEVIYEKAFSFGGEKIRNNGFFDNYIKKLDSMTDELINLINTNLKNCIKEGLGMYLDINWNSRYIEKDEEADAWGFSEEQVEVNNEKVGSPANDEEQKNNYYFGSVTDFQELIKFGLSERVIINNSTNSSFTSSKELGEIFKLIVQLKYIKRCVGTKGINFHKFQITFLNNLSRILQNYVFKINKFRKSEAARQIKLDILQVYQKVLQLSTINSSRTGEIDCYTYFKLVENQKGFMKLMEICNVLMTNEETLKHYAPVGRPMNEISSFIFDFNNFRNAEDFSRMIDYLNLKCLTEADIYDLVSRIVLV